MIVVFVVRSIELCKSRVEMINTNGMVRRKYWQDKRQVRKRAARGIKKLVWI